MGLQNDGGFRVGLGGHDKPLVGLGNPGRHYAVGALHLFLGLPDLMHGKIQGLLLSKDRLPGQVAAHSFIQVLQSILVRCEEDKGIGEYAR